MTGEDRPVWAWRVRTVTGSRVLAEYPGDAYGKLQAEAYRDGFRDGQASNRCAHMQPPAMLTLEPPSWRALVDELTEAVALGAFSATQLAAIESGACGMTREKLARVREDVAREGRAIINERRRARALER